MLKEIYKVKASDFNNALSNYLKLTEKINLPVNVDIIKTSHGKQRSPYDSDWYYKRAAAIVRKLATNEKGYTVIKLSKMFGCNKNYGTMPSHHVDASRGHIRRILQSLEAINWVKKDKTRILSEEGKQEISQLINRMINQE